MSNVQEVKDDNFEQEITNYSGVALVDFAAEWCGPCQRLAPIIDQLAGEYAGKAKIVRVDIDNARKTATNFGIMSVPTVILFKDGKEVDRSIGLVPKQQLASMLDGALG